MKLEIEEKEGGCGTLGVIKRDFFQKNSRHTWDV